MLREENIKIIKDVLNWKEAIEIAGSLLLQNKSIHENYTNSMINAINEFGPYIAIAPGIAIAHAKPGKDVIKDDIVLVVLKGGTSFNSKNDPIYALFAFCTLNADEHLMFLSDIANYLSDETLIPKLISADTVKEVYSMFTEENE